MAWLGMIGGTSMFISLKLFEVDSLIGNNDGLFACSGTSRRVDLPGLVSGILAAVILVAISVVLGCYCFKNRGTRGRSVAV